MFIKSCKKKKKTALTINNQGKSYLTLFFDILIVTKNKAVEKTSPILAMFDPITFEIAMSLELFKAELILIRSSGAEVAKDTTVNQ